MNDENRPDRSVLDRLRETAGRIRRAIAGDDTGGEYVDPRENQLKEHERKKINEFVELAEEKGRDDEHQDEDGNDDGPSS